MAEFPFPFDSTDPGEWAEAFCRIYAGHVVAAPGVFDTVDKETMTTWFEQAIQSGRNAEAAGY